MTLSVRHVGNMNFECTPSIVIL